MSGLKIKDARVKGLGFREPGGERHGAGFLGLPRRPVVLQSLLQHTAFSASIILRHHLDP